ncbi:putative ATPase [Pedobacter sp. AK017]|uniref:AAA family ATPase n=1 Tax=Pedobacter sp. AK017 TaxID=2723073 RepID=UPI001609A900|nr:AAA family ATPase [Pedobacter sp. AK017]MBB5436931.1 putative ATPase [Pedobacter sp. AK017]
MKETLHVKNFGPIVDAYIEIKDINIFIGTTSSGKSTLAKLIAIFKSGDLDRPIQNSFFGEDSDQTNFIEHLASYNIEYDIHSETYIKYTIGNIFYELNGHTFNKSEDRLTWEDKVTAIYIPAERVFFPTFSQSIFSFLNNSITLPKWLIDFGAKFEKARTELVRFRVDFLGANYLYTHNDDYVDLDNGGSIKLSQASSGLQSVLPLMLVIERFSKLLRTNANLYVIEEPELNLYPLAQKDLLEFIINNNNSSKDKLVITTHSPYLLTTMDNLIQAGNVAAIKPEIKHEIVDIVPENLWLNFDDISCYYFNNGTVVSTLDHEMKSIGPSNIDDVSEKLSATFEQLLTLKYKD